MPSILKNLSPRLNGFGGEGEKRAKLNLRSTSPQIPCLRRVPFEATKRNQKSPLGAGPAICTARIPLEDLPGSLPCQPRKNNDPRCWTGLRAVLRESFRKAFRAHLHWFSMGDQLSARNEKQKADCHTARRCQSTMAAPSRGQPQGFPLQMQKQRGRWRRWGFFPRLSVQHWSTVCSYGYAGHRRLYQAVRRFAEKPAPRRAAPFFLVLFLGRTRKRTKKKEKLRIKGTARSMTSRVPEQDP